MSFFGGDESDADESQGSLGCFEGRFKRGYGVWLLLAVAPAAAGEETGVAGTGIGCEGGHTCTSKDSSTTTMLSPCNGAVGVEP